MYYIKHPAYTFNIVIFIFDTIKLQNPLSILKLKLAVSAEICSTKLILVLVGQNVCAPGEASSLWLSSACSLSICIMFPTSLSFPHSLHF